MENPPDIVMHTHKLILKSQSIADDPSDAKIRNDGVNCNLELSESLLCIRCGGLLFPAMQVACCGQYVCQNCAKIKLTQLTQCPFCFKTGTPKAVQDKGYQRELDNRRINCPRCEESNKSIKELSEHLETHRDLECDDCEQKFTFQQELKKHQQHDCQYRKIQCALALVGCSTKIDSDKLAEHYRTNKHQQCLLEFIIQILPQCSQKQLKRSLQNTMHGKYHLQLKECQGRMEQLLRNIMEKLDNCGRLRTESQAFQEKLHELNAQLKKSRDSFEDGAKILQGSHDILSMMKNMLKGLKSKTIGPQIISPDGIFIFKVSIQYLTDVDQSLESEWIHSSQSGYRMVLFYETYTDRQSNRRYLAISFSILKGEYDAILFWPMVYPITISIINLTGKDKSITRRIPQDSQMANFQRPDGDANPPVKIHKFCAIDEILERKNTYVHDNSIYVEFKMDFATTVADPINEKAASRISTDSIQRNMLPDVK